MSTPSTLPLATDTGRLDAESHRWVRRLGASGADREAAIGEPKVLLLNAAPFEVARRRAILGRRYDAEHEDLAQQSADDALMAVLGKLDQLRGGSRFTTCAHLEGCPACNEDHESLLAYLAASGQARNTPRAAHHTNKGGEEKND